MKKNQTKGAGRPAYVPVVPRGKFTFAEFCEANGVNLKTGKGKRCSALTLRKFLKRDAALGKKSAVILTDELAEPNNKKGLGRKSFMFQRRAGVNTTIAKAHRTVKTASVKVATESYEQTKQNLGITAPAPVAETPVAETPAPVAETPAPVAETVTAPATSETIPVA